MKGLETINVLGTVYDVLICNDADMQNQDNAGECDRYDKIIRINEDAFSGSDAVPNILRAKNKVIRHEIIHAFFHEAGLDCYAEDEVLVDALAILIPKITNIFKEVKANDGK